MALKKEEASRKNKGFKAVHRLLESRSVLVAERVGFEPTYGLLTRNPISSRARYGHFATSPRRKEES